MQKTGKTQLIAVLAIGGLLGYVAASSRIGVMGNAKAEPSPQGASHKDCGTHASADNRGTAEP